MELYFHGNQKQSEKNIDITDNEIGIFCPCYYLPYSIKSYLWAGTFRKFCMKSSPSLYGLSYRHRKSQYFSDNISSFMIVKDMFLTFFSASETVFYLFINRSINMLYYQSCCYLFQATFFNQLILLPVNFAPGYNHWWKTCFYEAHC